MNREQALQQLRRIVDQVSPTSPDEFCRIAAEIRDAKDGVIARYRPMFSLEQVDELTAEDFRGFLLFRNNRHWDSLHRQGGRMTEDMDRLREAIRLLVDESVPLRSRLDRLRPARGDPMVSGLGRAVITAILQVVYPDKYGVLNNTSEAGMKRLGLWPAFPRGATFGQRYEAVNRVLLDTVEELDVDLWTLDMLWWRDEPHVPRGSQGVADEKWETAADGKEALPSEPSAPSAAFVLETHLQAFLVENWDHVPFLQEWQLLEEDGEVVGEYYDTREVGEIDLLARHRCEKRWLVIELKRNQTSDSTVGQVLRYMTWVRRNLATDGGEVKGLIICREVDPKLQFAIDGQPQIDCVTYEVSFTLSPAPKLPRN